MIALNLTRRRASEWAARAVVLGLAAAVAAVNTGCKQDMADQPRPEDNSATAGDGQ